ncbi:MULTISPECIES: DUF4232 domain-containing protein [Streptomyces]|uniref:DUF4232 domain-containing protein n=1 Tax=Streptomyces TaxID=1883 RepID=UPI00163C99DF|nr:MULTISPECIES: DUF4232 domain-containing protein [Streptomyces]MBC2873617.1 DUF4232 domain-containing protein [Streptomyces sp. TYQ1024]UBI37948.1 DUF4232 domain-containing protein [Streptomyces mobaraensis]UKW30534.1 DUF4232 domain-containing protein [Streptomyces sp. TYQ1024]
MTHRLLRTTAVALTAAAALTLTACGGGGGGGGKGDGDGKSDKSAATASDAPPGAAGEDSAGKGAKKGDACAPADVKVEARPAKKPAGALLLVATAKKECTAYGFPFLRFDKDQATADMDAASKPKEPVRLAAGKAAYAGVRPTSPDGGTAREAKELSVGLQAANGDPVEGGEVPAALPGGKLRIDDSVRTSYWVASEGAALGG